MGALGGKSKEAGGEHVRGAKPEAVDAPPCPPMPPLRTFDSQMDSTEQAVVLAQDERLGNAAPILIAARALLHDSRGVCVADVQEDEVPGLGALAVSGLDGDAQNRTAAEVQVLDLRLLLLELLLAHVGLERSFVELQLSPIPRGDVE